jgi:hypothetical chaperone protein
MYVGLDFGTTNSSASIYDGQHITLLPLDPVNPNPTVMRSTLFMTREGERFIGREAINRFTTANVGRKIEYRWQNFGEYELVNDKGEIIRQTIGALIDSNQPGRLFQSLKTLLRDADYQSTEVFGKRYELEFLIAIVLRMIVTRIEQVSGQAVTRMVIGRPVNYAEDPADHALALARMRTACELAEIPDFAFLPEPNAAALAFARTAQARQRCAHRWRYHGSAPHEGQIVAAFWITRNHWPTTPAIPRRHYRAPHRVATHLGALQTQISTHHRGCAHQQ